MGYKGSWSRGSASSYCIGFCYWRDKKCDDCLNSEWKKHAKTVRPKPRKRRIGKN